MFIFLYLFMFMFMFMFMFFNLILLNGAKIPKEKRCPSFVRLVFKNSM